MSLEFWGPDDYDRLFRKYTKHYFGPHFDWRWFKAQGIAESGLRPNAHSSAGAKGIMQILPATAAGWAAAALAVGMPLTLADPTGTPIV